MGWITNEEAVLDYFLQTMPRDKAEIAVMFRGTSANPAQFIWRFEVIKSVKAPGLSRLSTKSNSWSLDPPLVKDYLRTGHEADTVTL